MNTVQLLGYIGQQPEINYTQSGMAIGKFSLATKKRVKGEDKTSWHRCVAFQQTAELVGKYVNKGDQLAVEGDISYGSYDMDGHTVYTSDIIVNRIHFVGGRKESQQNNQSDRQRTQQTGQNQYGQNQQPKIGTDIPF